MLKNFVSKRFVGSSLVARDGSVWNDNLAKKLERVKSKPGKNEAVSARKLMRPGADADSVAPPRYNQAVARHLLNSLYAKHTGAQVSANNTEPTLPDSKQAGKIREYMSLPSRAFNRRNSAGKLKYSVRKMMMDDKRQQTQVEYVPAMRPRVRYGLRLKGSEPFLRQYYDDETCDVSEDGEA